MKLSVQYKLTLIFTGMIAIVLLSIMVIMYNISSGFRQNNFFKSLEDRARMIAISYHEPEFKNALDGLKEHHIHRIVEADDYIINMGNEERPHDLLLENKFWTDVQNKGTAWTIVDGKSYVAVSFFDKEEMSDIVVVSSSKDIQGDTYREKLKGTLVSAFLVALLFMTIISLMFSKWLVTPVMKMIQSVNNINAFNLGTRLDKDEFSDEISELKDTFNEMMERIDGAFKNQQKFIGDTTHSLRTPLTIIMGEVEIAQTQLDPNHKAYYSLFMIQQEAEKLNQIVNTLLSIARKDSDNTQQDWGIINVEFLISSICKTIQRMDNSNKLKINNQLSKPMNPPLVNGNEALLNLAISNIILNGIKYSGGKLIEINYGIVSNNIYLEIKDKGIGIPTEDFEKIFVPYYRSPNTKGFEGFGIGLPLTKDIIRMHSGSIQVSSKENVGSIFRVELPLANQESHT